MSTSAALLDASPLPNGSTPTAGGASGRPDDASLQALCLLARLHHVSAEPAHLRHQLGKAPSDPIATHDLLLAAKQIGLKARRSRTASERLSLTPLPALALMRDGTVAVLAQCDGQRVLLQEFTNADQSRPKIEPLEVFAGSWSGELILVASRGSVAGELATFDFSWFIPSLVKYRRLLGEVFVVSLFLQLFALVSPLFFQVVMDKVLVHRGITTLDVLVIGLLVVVVFESALTVLRNYVLSHTTSRIDVELGSKLFRHLLNLPLSYFQARRVGDSVARVRELEHIRSFLTGSSLTLVLDVLFSAVFIAVMFAYSVPLTLIVLSSLPVYLGLSLLVVPALRARLNDKFARGAENQALLVETITGIQTVKSGALEPQLAKRWDDQLAAYIVNATADFITELTGEGSDTVLASATYTLSNGHVEHLTLTGTNAINGTGNGLANLLTGNSGVNTLTGADGNDTLNGGGSADSMVGGVGDDLYIVDLSGDVVSEAAGAGTDTVQASASWTMSANVENLVLTGGNAIDGTGGTGANRITGNAAVNRLDGGGGADTLIGGAGDDAYVVDNAGDVVTEAANEGTDTVTTSINYTLAAQVENLVLSGSGGLSGSGNDRDNFLTGNAGNNTLTGYAGNDTLDGGAGNDTMIGGDGNDSYWVNVGTDAVTELANGGTDTVLSSVTLNLTTFGAALENLTLTSTATIHATGNTLANKLVGNGAANVLTGGLGNDTLDGGAGNDTLVGGSAADSYLFGRGSGTDTLQENDAAAGVKDMVLLQGSLVQTDLKFTKAGNNLEMAIVGASDKLVMQNWYLGNAYHVEEFRFSNGSVLTDSQAQALVGAMAAFTGGGTSSLGSSNRQPEMSIGAFDLAPNAIA